MKPVYDLISVEKIETPDGLQGNDWYRYIIEKHNSKIEGLRSGTLNEVTRHAEQYTEDLNIRVKSGGSTYSPRNKTAPAKAK